MASFGDLGIEEQKQRGAQPEEKIQRRAQHPDGDAAAPDAHQIIAQADRQAQQKTGQQREGLGLYAEGHRRNSRLSKPPCRSLSS